MHAASPPDALPQSVCAPVQTPPVQAVPPPPVPPPTVPPKLVPPAPVPTPPVPAVPVISRALTKLDVPYDEKENVKALHAQWDPVGKYWYVNPFTDLRPFARWVPGARINLDVPFAEKNAVKDLGAKWDPEAGKWHVHDKMKNLELFAKCGCRPPACGEMERPVFRLRSALLSCLCEQPLFCTYKPFFVNYPDIPRGSGWYRWVC